MGPAARPTGTTPLIFATFLMASGSIAVFPLLPDLQEELGLSTASLGFITAASFLAAVVAQVAIAPLADRGHERRLLVAGLLMSAAALASTALAWDATSLVVARSVEGLAFGTFVPAARGMTARGAGSRIAEHLGRLSAAEFAGVAVGPLGAAALASWISVDVALVTFAVLSLATVPLVALVRPSVEPVGAASTSAESLPGPMRRSEPRIALDLVRERPMQVALLLTVALMVPVGAYDTLWARYLTDNGGTTLLVGASLTVFAIPYIVLARRAGRLADRLGAVKAAVLGMCVTTAVIFAYALLRSPAIITAVGLAESTGQALAGPAAQASVAQAVPRRRAAAAQGLAGAVGTAAGGLVAAVAAPVYAWGGQELLFGATGVVVLVLLAAAVVRARGLDMAAGRDAPEVDLAAVPGPSAPLERPAAASEIGTGRAAAAVAR